MSIGAITGARAALAFVRGSWKLIAAAVVVVAVAAALWWANDRGYESAQAECEAQRRAEVERQASITREALDAAAEREKKARAAINDLRDQVRRMEDEARRDPNAGRPAVGARSVQRLNSIRRP